MFGKENASIPQNAFIIINGAEIYPLEKVTINIGRKSDNDIVLSEQHISRYHAQLRARDGKFILVDLRSTGGTSVNGERISEAQLIPGDVISIAGIPLIYGESSMADQIDQFTARKSRTKSGDSRSGLTDSVDLGSVDRFLEFFDQEDE
jgi:pSer/pThr/pTyr-binding forkhead associated (FHA) protein